MARKSFTEGNWRNDPWFRALCTAIATCKNETEIADFLRDVGTLTELQAWSERLEVAKRVLQGDTYRAITAKTGASTTTVTRVARFLQSGEGGYQRILKLAKHHHHSATSRGERMASMVRK